MNCAYLQAENSNLEDVENLSISESILCLFNKLSIEYTSDTITESFGTILSKLVFESELQR